ncbi:hypothetical protein [Streptomyces sp. JJ38]|uniref:hypothetical protein n=1 Tax=Streptomyces sp. JJ38 TaxID=2738128 RepID=UPI001C588D26|nr:hypothetical protein [Streptomyces sp. JJ38]MBW1597454.1 hypothetical protein [Streptomyces sp. JJ38]
MPETLLRRDLGFGQLSLRVVLVLAAGAGVGFVGAGADRSDGSGGGLTGVGAALLAGAVVALAALARASLARRRLLQAMRHSQPAPAGLAGLRAAWGVVSGLALLAGLLTLGAGLTGAARAAYDESDVAVYGALLAWGVLLLSTGTVGAVKALRTFGGSPGHAYAAGGHLPGTVDAPPGWAPGAASPGQAGRTAPAFAAPVPLPMSPEEEYQARLERLYYRTRGRPVAPHFLSTRLTYAIPGLTRAGALALYVTAALVLGGTGVAASVLSVWADTFLWPVLILSGVLWLALLMELVTYGARVGGIVFVTVSVIGVLAVPYAGYSSQVLLDRGELVTAEVTRTKMPTRGGERCFLRPEGSGRELSRSVSCAGRDVGDRVRVYIDPRDRVPPSDDPYGDRTFALWGGALTLTMLAGSAVWSVTTGYRRRRELGLLGRPAADPRQRP